MRYPLSATGFELVFIKVLFPAIWILGFGLGTLAVWFAPTAPSKAPGLAMQIHFTVAWVLGIVLLRFTCMNLKSVELDEADRALHIGNLRRTLRVPLADIDPLVGHGWSSRPPILYLRLRRPCDFGRSIPFIPNLRQPWHVSQTRAIAQFIAEINARLDRLR